MSKFFVGQLVKTVRLPEKCHTSNPSHGAGIGEGGVVMGTTSCPNHGFHGRSGDDLSVHLFLRNVTGMAPAYCFEPIELAVDKERITEDARPCKGEV